MHMRNDPSSDDYYRWGPLGSCRLDDVGHAQSFDFFNHKFSGFRHSPIPSLHDGLSPRLQVDSMGCDVSLSKMPMQHIVKFGIDAPKTLLKTLGNMVLVEVLHRKLLHFRPEV